MAKHRVSTRRRHRASDVVVLVFNISVLTLTEDDDNDYHLTKVRVYWKWDLKRFNTLSDSYEESLLLWPEH